MNGLLENTNPTIKKFIVIVAIIFIFILFKVAIGLREPKYLTVNPNIEALVEGPKYVIFDLGANIGDSARFFSDPSFMNQDSPPFHELKAFCSKGNRKCIINSFEANPRFIEQLDENKKIIESLGHTHNVYKQSAAWIKNENLTFYLDTVSADHNYWGSR